MAAFARLHDIIDWLVVGFIDARSERGWAELDAPLLTSSRRRDEDVPKTLRAISDAVGSDSELREFPNYFKQVKDTRDLLAHSMVLEAVQSDGVWVLYVGSYHDDRRARRALSENDLTLRALNLGSAKLLWLMEQVEWIRFRARVPGGPSALPVPRQRPLESPHFEVASSAQN
jgi:hypothetical protein